MDIKSEYDRLSDAVIKEHTEVFARQDLVQVEALMDAIIAAKKLVVMGVGREGIASRAFAMRLMHLGKETHWVWDDTTPGIHKGDLLIATNGSGEIGHIHYVAEQAKAAGAKVAVITGSPGGKTPAMADLVLFVPAFVYKGTDRRVVPSIQPMGNLFEQHLIMLFDIIIMLLEQKMGITHEEMESRHRNIE
ncbi:silent information regulator protein Sir2 [Spirochaetia bacterium]|nr:silent information regulator protein Sir2 [Spirochaetia bacterium]